jgi:hypothetical protein
MKAAAHLSAAEWLVAGSRGARLRPRSQRHLDACRRCRADVDRLARLARYLREPAPEPAAGILARAWALVEPRAPRRREWDRFAVARLVHDTSRAAAAGLRAASRPRAQRWRHRDADVDLRIDPGGLGAPPTLTGQVLPRRASAAAPAYGLIWLLEPRRRPRWASLDRGGEFSLPAPQGRRWAVCLEWGDLRLRLEMP